jgi:very-short-patch-repair endonuclease
MPEPAPTYNVRAGMTELEAAFHFYWRILAVDAPRPEHDTQFHPDRQWRADFLWRDHRVIVECEGGHWMSTGNFGKGHGHPTRFEEDVEKYNAATALGYKVFRCTTKLLRENPERFVKLVRQSMEGA